MDTFWFIVVASLLVASSITVGVIRNRRFRKKEEFHQETAARLSLDMAYASQTDFAFFGEYRGYAFRIEPVNLAPPGSKTPSWFLRLSIPMTNPLRKMIRISRRDLKASVLEQIIPMARPDSVSHDMESWLDIQTNDLMFSSVILSENVKISIHQAFRALSAGVLGVEDAELLCVFPGLLSDSDQQTNTLLAAEVMCDIKDELQA